MRIVIKRLLNFLSTTPKCIPNDAFTGHAFSRRRIGITRGRTASLVPRPRPPGEGKGLVTIARFLVCAESAVLFSRQPIRLLGLKISCDIKRP